MFVVKFPVIVVVRVRVVTSLADTDEYNDRSANPAESGLLKSFKVSPAHRCRQPKPIGERNRLLLWVGGLSAVETIAGDARQRPRNCRQDQ